MSKIKKVSKIKRVSKKYKNMGIVCHRGASSQYSENTYLSIEQCAKFNSAGSELDIQLTKDYKVITLHDTTLERTSVGIMPGVKMTGKRYNKIIRTPVYKLEYKDIKKINIGTEINPSSAPLLRDIIDLSYKYKGFFLVIEIAGATSDKISDFNIITPLKKLLQKYKNITKKIKIISFGPDVLILLNSDPFFKRFERYWVLETRDFDIHKTKYGERAISNPNGGINENLCKGGIKAFIKRAKRKDLNLTGLDLEAENTKSFMRNVKEIKKSKLKVITWVYKHPTQASNDGGDIALFQDKSGVNYFTTNIPNSILTIES